MRESESFSFWFLQNNSVIQTIDNSQCEKVWRFLVNRKLNVSQKFWHCYKKKH